MLSFSWNCELIVESADSQGATRPSYFGPDSQKFNSRGLAACACPTEAAAMSTPSATPKPNREPTLELSFFRDFGARMGNPRNDPVTSTVPRSPDEVKCTTATPST